MKTCFAVTPVTSSEDQEAETLNSEETIDEPVKETFVEDKHIGAAPGVEASVYFPKNLNNGNRLDPILCSAQVHLNSRGLSIVYI